MGETAEWMNDVGCGMVERRSRGGVDGEGGACGGGKGKNGGGVHRRVERGAGGFRAREGWEGGACEA